MRKCFAVRKNGCHHREKWYTCLFQLQQCPVSDLQTERGNQKASTTSRLSRASMSIPKPPIAFLLMRVAKFLGPSSSAPEGGPRGCLVGWLIDLLPCTGPIVTEESCWLCSEGVAETGRPMPRPS